MAKKLAILDLKETNTASGFVGLGAKAGRIFQKVGTVETLLTLEGHSHSWSQVTGKPATFAPSTHSHAWADITSKPSTFAPSTHSHAWADITSKPSTFAPSTHNHDTLYRPIGYVPTWAEVTEKPSTFTPVSHTHTWAQVTSKPSTFTPSAHTLGSHSDVTITSNTSGEILKWDGTKWINNTLAEAGISASSHSHSWSQITSKPSTFAPSAHNHDALYKPIGYHPTWAQVTSKPSTFTPSAHTLGSHSDVTITSNTSGEILKWDGTKWINNTLAEAGISASSHSHSWSQITSKPSTFAPSAHNHDALYKPIGYHPTWAQVTSKPSTFAPTSHTHIWTDITNRPTSLTSFTNNLTNFQNNIEIGAIGVNTSKNLRVFGTITVMNAYKDSDITLKKDIKGIDSTLIDKVNLVEFNWKSDNKKDYGVIAQDLEVYYPELVNTDDTGIKSVNYESLYAIKIARLEERIKELEEKLWQK